MPGSDTVDRLDIAAVAPHPDDLESGGDGVCPVSPRQQLANRHPGPPRRTRTRGIRCSDPERPGKFSTGLPGSPGRLSHLALADARPSGEGPRGGSDPEEQAEWAAPRLSPRIPHGAVRLQADTGIIDGSNPCSGDYSLFVNN